MVRRRSRNDELAQRLEAQAWEAMREKNLAAAEALYRLLLELFPDHAAARNNLSAILLDSGRRDEATALLAAGPPPEPSRRPLPAHLDPAADSQDGEQRLRQALSDLMGRVVFFTNQANALVQRGEREEAFLACEQGLAAEEELNAVLRGRALGQSLWMTAGTVNHLWALIEQQRYLEAVALVEERLGRAEEMRLRLENPAQRDRVQHMLSKGLVAALRSGDEALMNRGRLIAEKTLEWVPEPDHGELLWSLACLEARSHRPRPALRWAERAVAAGVAPADLAADPDLACLRPLPEFRKLTQKDR
jgi:tetratricopeptide (TPR) repeat protein